MYSTPTLSKIMVQCNMAAYLKGNCYLGDIPYTFHWINCRDDLPFGCRIDRGIDFRSTARGDGKGGRKGELWSVWKLIEIKKTSWRQ